MSLQNESKQLIKELKGFIKTIESLPKEVAKNKDVEKEVKNATNKVRSLQSHVVKVVADGSKHSSK